MKERRRRDVTFHCRFFFKTKVRKIGALSTYPIHLLATASPEDAEVVRVVKAELQSGRSTDLWQGHVEANKSNLPPVYSCGFLAVPSQHIERS